MTAKIQYEDIDLYHYTSLASLFAILQNETIRLTDYRFLNDTQELSYATHWLKALLQPMAENEFVQKLLTAIENIEQGKVERLKGIGEDLPYLQWNMCDLNYYILSLSQNYDDLAMWRMYAKAIFMLKRKVWRLNSQAILQDVIINHLFIMKHQPKFYNSIHILSGIIADRTLY